MATAAAKKLKIDRKRIALVHVAKRNLGLTDDEYRAALGSVGAKSAADLYPSQFLRLMDHFETMGFVSINRKPGVKKSRDAMRDKITAIMADIGVTDAYVNAISKHMGFNVDLWKWCDAAQMQKLMVALIYHQKKQAGRKGEKSFAPTDGGANA